MDKIIKENTKIILEAVAAVVVCLLIVLFVHSLFKTSDAMAEEANAKVIEELEADFDSDPGIGYVAARDFWVGEDYFDLEAYLEANGAYFMMPDEDFSVALQIYLNDRAWELGQFNEDSFYVFDFREADYASDDPFMVSGSVLPDMVKIDDAGNELTKGTVMAIDHVIYSIKKYPDEPTPLEYANVSYSRYPKAN